MRWGVEPVDDSYTSWDKVEEFIDRFMIIQSITNDEDRIEVAKALVESLVS